MPELWARYAYPSLKPLASWVKDYQDRIAFMRGWLTNGVPKCFWLPGFFFPQVRLSALLFSAGRSRRAALLLFSFPQATAPARCLGGGVLPSLRATAAWRGSFSSLGNPVAADPEPRCYLRASHKPSCRAS